MLIAIILLVLLVSVLFLFWQDINKEKVNNQRSDITFEKAENYLALGDNKEAIKAYRFLLDQGDLTQDILFGLGVAHYGQLQYQESKSYFNQVIVMNHPHNQKKSDSYLYLALIAEREGDWDLATEYSLRAKNLFFSENTYFSPDFLMILINCSIEKGDIEMAEKYVAEIESLDRELSLENNTLILKQKGLLAINKGDYQLAEKYFLDAHQLIDSSSQEIDKYDVRHGILVSLFGLGKYQEAIDFTNQADVFSEGRMNILWPAIYSFGVSNIKVGDLDKAEDTLNRMQRMRFSLHPNAFYEHITYSALVHHGNGILATAKNDEDQAILSFEGAVEVIDQISSKRYEMLTLPQKSTMKFINLLSLYELANLSGDRDSLNKANNLINSLSAEELTLISTREMGNEGSIIEKIKGLRI